MNETVTARESKQEKRILVPQLAVSKRFGIYKDEEKKAVRAPDIEKSDIQVQLEKAWDRFEFARVCLDDPEGNERNYRYALKAVKGLPTTERDIESFTIGILPSVFQRWEGFAPKAGFFISALINTCYGSDFTIHTQHIETPLDYIGYRNRKKVVVIGNAGKRLGTEMCEGSIVVKGDVGERAGADMGGGSIIVEGNAENKVGDCMENGIIEICGNASYGLGSEMYGGSIIVRGNAAFELGENMLGGEIHVDGDIEGIAREKGSYLKHGRVYHKGKLIVCK